MKKQVNDFYLDEKPWRGRFWTLRWWVEWLPVIARLTLMVDPAAGRVDGQRAQQYLDLLRENGPVPGLVPPAKRAGRETAPTEDFSNAA